MILPLSEMVLLSVRSGKMGAFKAMSRDEQGYEGGAQGCAMISDPIRFPYFEQLCKCTQSSAFAL